MKVGVVGIGLVGSAIKESFSQKGFVLNKDLFCYDKYNSSYGDFNSLLNTDFLFLSLPTKFSNTLREYDKSAIHDVCTRLEDEKYEGLVIIKSTLEPGSTKEFSEKYKLNIIHSPEFLSSRTAFEDFHNQRHVVIGNPGSVSTKTLEDFFKKYYPEANISMCTSTESESMKIFCNSFYATKVQLFTEFYLISKKNNSDFEKIKEMMLLNECINPMHTKIPGPDGEISYGGLCFPKDTNALANYLKKNESPSKVLSSVIEERNEMREDNLNID